MKKDNSKPIFGNYRGNWMVAGLALVFGLMLVLGSYTIDPNVYPGQSAGTLLLGYIFIIPSVLWMGFLFIMGVIGLIFGCEYVKKKKNK